MRIENTEVFGLERAIRASGYPMQKDDYSETRAKRLASCKPGTGHDSFLKGIVVICDITAPQYWWLQFQRYHFWHGTGRDTLTDIVSSESKMHRILKMDISEQCNKYVDVGVIKNLKTLINNYNKIKKLGENDKTLYQIIIANTPMGLMLKAAVTMSYLQIKTIRLQRSGHKLEEWAYFCDWADRLPKFKELVMGVQTNEP